MNKPIRLLHTAYRFGAVLDGLVVIPLLAPKAAGVMLGIRGFAPRSDYRYAAGVAAALMAGWTALLVWADRSPVERRGVLVLTIVPTLVGLVAAGAYAVGSGLAGHTAMLPTFVVQTFTCGLFATAFRQARRCAHDTPDR